ncbi:MAG: hypothetical protein JJU29_20110 [Verrucomicrobia bacterium]|nr:hypothetical protein [Verrucomicrobiota bacterium]
MTAKNTISTIFFAIQICVGSTMAMDVQLRIGQHDEVEGVITRENLLLIKKFIIQGGLRETYGNMYNNNPAYHTSNFRFYLNPDTGQKNINCDLDKSGFHNIAIRSTSGKILGYLTVDFQEQNTVKVRLSRPTDDLTIGQLLKFVEDALKEILEEMNQEKPNNELEVKR